MRIPNRIVLFLIPLLLGGLALGLAVHAQAPGGEEELEAEGVVGATGLTDPVPDGFRLMYMFTNAANDTAGDDAIATVIHCTNYGSEDVDVSVVMYSFTGNAGFTATTTLASNATDTFASQDVEIFDVNEIVGVSLPGEGSGRVLVTADTVICAGHLTTPGAPPKFVAKLPMFDASGHLVGSQRRIFLPGLLKDD